MDEELLGELAVGLERAISSVTSSPAVTAWRATTSSSPLSFGRKKSARQMRSCLGWRGKTKRSSTVSRSSGSRTTTSLPSL